MFSSIYWQSTVDGVTEKNLGVNVVKRLSEDIYGKGYYLFLIIFLLILF